ncbi:MAG: BTAD domain-containing putative transcriptional regulator, partial [Eggerthellaceae bacterium]|nr:BTAD domain-containing putative transcriptional regulator [Eggerthellaceae bacterium]
LTAAWVLDECASSDADALFAQATPGEGVGSPAHPVLLRVSVSEQIDRVARFVRDHVERACSHAPLSWFSLVAGSALERNAEVDLPVEMPALSPEASFELHQAEVALFAQRDAYRRRRTARRRERQEFELTHPDAYRADAASQASSIARASDAAAHASARTAVPTLRVTLFGGVEAHIGGQLVDPRLLSRRKAKTLLALLVLSHGRETSRDRLSGLLWPDRELEASRRNFYSVWSHLKRTLEVDGRCPYLIRSPTGCRLDARLVSSDAYDFEALTRSLLFGTSDKEDWEHLYARVSGEFAEELAPYEEHNEVIDALRDRYRVQLVDGLVAASTRLGMQGEARGSLWFAREALGRDKTREDAYVALMEAQIASGQRSAALDTYFSCRRFLTEQLGIDPSPRIVDLYCSVIETEETLV